LQAIFARGNIKLNNVAYQLADEQQFEIDNDDSQFWLMDVLLSDTCKQFFGCTDTECIPAAPVCNGNYTSAILTGGGTGFQLFGGYLTTGESITWDLLLDGTVVDSGLINTASPFPNADNFHDVFDFDTQCYTLRWIKNCVCSDSAPATADLGNCEPCCTPDIVSASAETVTPTATLTIFSGTGAFTSIGGGLDVPIDADIHLNNIIAQGSANACPSYAAIASNQISGADALVIPAGSTGNSTSGHTTGTWNTTVTYRITTCTLQAPIGGVTNGQVVTIGSYSVTIVFQGCN